MYQALVYEEIIFWREFLSLGFICDCGAMIKLCLSFWVDEKQYNTVIHVIAITKHRDKLAWEYREEQEESPLDSILLYNAL